MGSAPGATNHADAFLETLDVLEIVPYKYGNDSIAVFPYS